MLQQQDLLKAVDWCYEAAATPGGFAQFVPRLGQLIAADAGDMVTEDTLRDSTDTFGSFGFDPGFRTAYDAEYLGQNPWVDTLKSAPAGRFHTDAIDPPEFRKSAYYNEWVRAQGFHGSVGALLEDGAGSWTWLGYVRRADRPEFEAETELLDQLYPHLCRAFHLHRELARLGDRPRRLLDRIAKAVLIVDRDGRVTEMNAGAEAALACGAFVMVDRGKRLHAVCPGDDARLQAAIFAALNVMDAPGTMGALPHGIALQDRDGNTAFAFLAPLRDDAEGRSEVIVTLSQENDHPGQVSALAGIYGLSPKETELAICLASGLSLADFAEQHGIAIGTARWHLKNIEQKCGVRRVEELVARLHRTIPPFS